MVSEWVESGTTLALIFFAKHTLPMRTSVRYYIITGFSLIVLFMEIFQTACNKGLKRPVHLLDDL